MKIYINSSEYEYFARNFSFPIAMVERGPNIRNYYIEDWEEFKSRNRFTRRKNRYKIRVFKID